MMTMSRPDYLARVVSWPHCHAMPTIPVRSCRVEDYDFVLALACSLTLFVLAGAHFWRDGCRLVSCAIAERAYCTVRVCWLGKMV